MIAAHAAAIAAATGSRGAMAGALPSASCIACPIWRPASAKPIVMPCAARLWLAAMMAAWWPGMKSMAARRDVKKGVEAARAAMRMGPSPGVAGGLMAARATERGREMSQPVMPAISEAVCAQSVWGVGRTNARDASRIVRAGPTPR